MCVGVICTRLLLHYAVQQQTPLAGRHWGDLVRAFITASFVGLLIAVSAPAFAQSCGGVVRGLSNDYDPETGSGFLAVRAGPRTSASQLGELFNGDEVTILGRRGNWYRIDAEDIGIGWAYARYIRREC